MREIQYELKTLSLNITTNFNHMKNTIPNKEQCELLLKEYNTPTHVIAHCNEVCRVAVSLAIRLNQVGYNINVPLLEASAKLHDIARVHEKHETVGALFLESKGYDEVAAVVAKHTKYLKYNDLENIEEIDLLCIGDRTVKEDTYVGVDERMEYIKQKAIRMGRGKFVEGIEKSKMDLKKYINDIEKKIGISLDNLMKGTYE